MLDEITKDNPAQRTTLIRLVSSLVDTSSNELAQAIKSWAEGDSGQAMKLLHTLRGAVGNVGAKQFAAATLAVEHAIERNASDVIDHFATARVELMKTLTVAEAWLKHPPNHV